MINIISYYEDTILYSPEKVHPYSVWGRKPQRGELPPLGLLSPSFSTLLKQDISTLQGLGHFYFALTRKKDNEVRTLNVEGTRFIYHISPLFLIR